MLKNVVAWLKSHPTVRMDERAYMACMFDLGVSSAEETLFRAAWNMATLPGQVGAATEALVEAAKKEEVAIVAWHDRNSHVLAYGAALGVARRAANAVRHDLGRSFSRRFF